MNPSSPLDVSALQERWIKRYRGNFGDPSALHEYRAGRIGFRELYDSAMRQAELMLAEVQQITADAFGDED